MAIALPKYHSKDYSVLAIILVPYTLLLNSVMLGSVYYRDLGVFGTASLVTAVAFSIFFLVCGLIAIALKKRLPDESQTNMRLTSMILIFLFMSGLYLGVLFKIYTSFSIITGVNMEEAFVWGYIGQAIINIFITFLMEGIARYDNWKVKLEETSRIQHFYQQSQMLGLKSQVNPHFLFNSLNSLSSLISVDEDRAEKFLNEMSKVYRYMLRNDGDHLVPLKDELDFLKSYFHLLKTRYGDSIRLELEVTDQSCDLLLPTLTMQVIVENAYSLNAISKKEPLVIRVVSAENEKLRIENNVKPKLLTENLDFDAGLDLLVKKYRALGYELLISDQPALRSIELPLISQKKGEM